MDFATLITWANFPPPLIFHSSSPYLTNLVIRGVWESVSKAFLEPRHTTFSALLLSTVPITSSPHKGIRLVRALEYTRYEEKLRAVQPPEAMATICNVGNFNHILFFFSYEGSPLLDRLLREAIGPPLLDIFKSQMDMSLEQSHLLRPALNRSLD